jgi:ribosomal-protein-alanine N-acetyltransferase
MPEVLTISQQCFREPWLEEDFIRCLRQRNCIGMVAEYDELIVGYMVYELCKKHLQLLTLAVAPECQRQSVGSQLVGKLKHKLTPQRRRAITTNVSERNLPGQLFFKACGFTATGAVEADEDDDETAYEFVYELGDEGGAIIARILEGDCRVTTETPGTTPGTARTGRRRA